MENKRFDEVLSEKSKEALKSETWKQVRTTMKTEIQHFTDSPEIQYFLIEKFGKNDNAYGIVWGNAIREYLKTSYSEENAQTEVVLDNVIYKVLKRDSVTSFYDAGGNILFDVENSRLAKEYEFVMKEIDDLEESECKIAKQIQETEEKNWKCSGGVDEKCEDCEKASEEEKTEEQELKKNGAVPMETASLLDVATGNIPVPTLEEVENAKTENEKPAKEWAKEKLQAELKATKEKGFAEPIINYLLKRCGEDNALAEDVAQKHKTWEKCCSYICSKARGQAKGNCVAVRDDVVYEWAEDYYHKDDKAEEEKNAKEAENLKKHRNEVAKKAGNKANIKASTKAPTVDKKADNLPKSAEPKKQEEPKAKKNSKGMEGQMDLFSLMGM